jgi:hypothetical protein
LVDYLVEMKVVTKVALLADQMVLMTADLMVETKGKMKVEQWVP